MSFPTGKSCGWRTAIASTGWKRKKKRLQKKEENELKTEELYY